MGLSGISPSSLLLILAIAALLFGTKRLRNIGHDLGAALRSFKQGLSQESTTTAIPKKNESQDV